MTRSKFKEVVEKGVVSFLSNLQHEGLTDQIVDKHFKIHKST